MPRLPHRAGMAALATLLFSLSVRSQQAPPAGAAAAAPANAAIERGRTLFAAQCAGCHAAGARGGPAGTVDLAQSAIATGDSDGQQLKEFLKTGRPERRMPAFSLADSDVADLAAFLRSASAPGRGRARGPVAAVVGDAKAGEAYFNGAGGCTKCHSVTRDLKGIGSRLPAAAIQGRVVLPRGNGGYPRSFSSPPDPTEAPVKVVVTPASGPSVSGTLLWVTDFNVTLVDAQGVRRTFARTGDVPKVEITDPLQAHLDLMRTLTDEHMHDLTAFLVGLK